MTSDSRCPSYQSLSQNQLLTDTLLLALTTGLDLIRKSMQHNKLLRLKAMAENPESNDSDSDVTVQANPETDPQYLYYRLFTDYIGITSNQPEFATNPYLGKVRRNSIAPPQEVLQFKRRLCNVESITDFASSTLYPSASNQSPMDDGDRVPDALGSTRDNPMELIVKASKYSMTQRIGKAYPQAQYIYYSLYTEDGVIEPKQAFKKYADGSPSIARIDKNLSPPQHDLDAVIRCIAYVEGFSPCVWHQLFASIVSRSPIDDLNVWDMQRGCPGSLPERPLIFVKSAEMKRRLRINGQGSTHLYPPGSAAFSIQQYDLYSDGVVRQEVLVGNGPEKRSVYRVSYNAMRAFVSATQVYGVSK